MCTPSLRGLGGVWYIAMSQVRAGLGVGQVAKGMHRVEDQGHAATTAVWCTIP